MLSNQDMRGQNPRKVSRHDAVLFPPPSPRKQVVDLNAILRCKAGQREAEKLNSEFWQSSGAGEIDPGKMGSPKTSF